MKQLGTARLVIIDYVNWKGERSERTIQPIRLEFGSNEWHPVPQWLLFAYDIDKADYRRFAFESIKAWDSVKS